MASINIQLDDDVAQVYALLAVLLNVKSKQQLYTLAQEQGLLNLIRRHVPNVMAERLPANRLIAQAFASVNQVGA